MAHFPTPIGVSVALGLFLAACAAPSGSDPGSDPGAGATADAGPGTCTGRDMTPAVVQVVTEQEMLTPAELAEDGSILVPAVYRTTTHQEIVSPRREVVFEVPCPEVFTPDFIRSLQRALQARGLYEGRLTGVMDAPTRRAVRAYQMGTGLNSDILSMETALALGLVPYGRDAARRAGL